ncbi:zinc-dependent alcohol dehydrogenase [Agromyces aerolatus]|uniref:zinc-dependent alcohol dehydrogenase n=1 Tax=Agromyces sp. LY-1074 TaxID=3074080 RepID=UPI002857EFFC|nr:MULTISPECIES: alcohol dehydrogenase catalytic domain-containing protein [unclassified Agromyces]MDR5701594.1 alcohol dehydrogenase catalytic domain-containing protein [Agromyces sp. LY-1074]MDR5706124.1 alcohol dehydrogenase catalytic domain-containing protein [Agromyces sp. LY-1358]
MTSSATALVQTGPKEQHFEEIPFPKLPPGAALLRVEANGICGSDVESFLGEDRIVPADRKYPRINGHEIVGVIEDLGPKTKHREGLNIGDRVAVNPVIPCGRCEPCTDGRMHMCAAGRFAVPVYGFIPTTVSPGLWGGYSTHVYLDPDTVVYPFPADFDPLTATLWNPLGGAIQWSIMTPGHRAGQSVVVLGSGQRGLAIVAAQRAVGSGLIVATGLTRDRHKLDLALEFGADAVIDVEQQDPVEAVLELTGGQGADLVIDTVPKITSTTLQGLQMVKTGGTFVNIGVKEATVDGFPIGRITSKNIRVIGAANSSIAAYRTAADLLIDGRVQLDKMRTHVFGFDRFEEALDTLEAKVPGTKSVNVVVTPTFTA